MTKLQCEIEHVVNNWELVLIGFLVGVLMMYIVMIIQHMNRY